MSAAVDIAAHAAARDALVATARAAGALAMTFFRPGATTTARIDAKHGGSPVTEADLAADALIAERLAAVFPDAGWLSEETADDPARLARRSLVVVDPIDGTRAFLSGDPRWAVSIALVVAGRPVAGVVHAPALRETYAAARGLGATLNDAPIHASRRRDFSTARVAGPKPTLAALAAKLGGVFEIAPRVPSLAYRLSLTASGALDFALAAADSHDWDIAASDILLEEAGAGLYDIHGERLVYNLDSARRGALIAAPFEAASVLVPAYKAALGGS